MRKSEMLTAQFKFQVNLQNHSNLTMLIILITKEQFYSLITALN